MTTRPLFSLHLPDPDATDHYAAACAPHLAAGDVLLLEGGIGAGKTHFARRLIQTRLERAEDVPSPTFTLVQTYAAPDVEIWHCDLYRLSDPSELVELGLEEAMEDAICLIEWPDRLGTDRPDTALTLRFEVTEDGASRTLTATGDADLWADRMPRCVP
ncbi:tRNA (adenosine(37)-N6)-threonylcarbamoyltransferase complex ATPase subunit type 1 TsaE [Pseudaestuariivita sp.]|uniref:tRNA (adenosine(37)-N6)-threonylcarbamoyltransferase complex ATPase subunit type 1 TsaE n=1 Tax=Pseudaestuariivita sp. TaxID=2211669 RepID=UPI004058BE76